MKATKTLMVAALAAAGMGMATFAGAQEKHGGHGYRGHHGGHHHHGGHRHWGRYWGPSWGFAIGVPLAFGSAYAWGHPYYWDSPRVAYRVVDAGYIGRVRPLPGEEGIRIEGVARPVESAPAAQPLQQQGAPRTGPLYMNYCESARGYYPKVTSCPEGWKFQAPQ